MAHPYMHPHPVLAAPAAPSPSISVNVNPPPSASLNSASPVLPSPDKRVTDASALEKNIEALLLDDESEEGSFYLVSSCY